MSSEGRESRWRVLTAVGWVGWRSWEGGRAVDVGIERRDIVKVCDLMLYSHFQVVIIDNCCCRIDTADMLA